MKHPTPPQSATSLPRAPRDDADKRFGKYAAMMAIRVLCFIAMVLIQPYGWYTWVLALAAVFLPYVAVVVANVGSDTKEIAAVPPERALEAAAPPPTAPPSASPSSPTASQERPVFRITESPAPGSDEGPGSRAP